MRTLYQVDAFTTTPFTGNPAGVVLDASGMSDELMLAVARELNNSETAFLLPPDGSDHDVRIRFFTPRTEVPACGHATVGAHFARAVAGGLAPGPLTQKTGGGLLQRVTVLRERDRIRIGLDQGTAVFGDMLPDGVTGRLLPALGVDPAQLDDAAPVQVVSTGHSKILVPLRGREAVDAAVPDHAALTAISRETGSNGFFIFTRSTDGPRPVTWSRMFAPASGIPEDPVTGNAHGPLGAYLVHHGLVPMTDGRLDFTGHQGTAMGRPGRVDVHVRAAPDGALNVSLTGDAVIAFRTTLDI